MYYVLRSPKGAIHERALLLCEHSMTALTDRPFRLRTFGAQQTLEIPPHSPVALLHPYSELISILDGFLCSTDFFYYLCAK